jgi:hypothetical protein
MDLIVEGKNIEFIDAIDEYATDATGKCLLGYGSVSERLRDDKSRSDYQYKAKDFYLVRRNDFIPQDESRTWKSLSEVPFVSLVLNSSYYITKYLLEKRGQSEFELEDIKEYIPYSTQYRSTIHFCLNGLVGSHEYGDFNGKFIVLDSLGHYIEDRVEENGNVVPQIGEKGRGLKNLWPSDTFFQGSMQLSSDAIVMVNQNDLDSMVRKKEDGTFELLEEYKYLDNYQIVVYKGDPRTAVEMELTKLGVVFEKINKHGIDGTSSTMTPINTYLDKVNECGVGINGHHSATRQYREDDMKNLELWSIYNRTFYQELFDYFGFSQEQAGIALRNIETMEERGQDSKAAHYFIDSFIPIIGEDNYFDFVSKYNKRIEQAIADGRYPTNKQILENPQRLKEVFANYPINSQGSSKSH